MENRSYFRRIKKAHRAQERIGGQMFIKLKDKFHKHEYWFAEWWSGILIVCAGIYGEFFPQSELFHKSITDGFIVFLPAYFWQIVFITCGLMQLCSLLSENIIGRGIAAFMAAFLLIWGTLNIFFYGQQWHFSQLAWSVFAVINLYALARILAGIERDHECV